MKIINFKIIAVSIGCLFSSAVYADEGASISSINKIVEKTTNKASLEITPEEAEVVRLTNLKRKKRGLTLLKINPHLTIVAREQSASMARHHHLSHSVNGKNFAARIKQSGYPYRHVGENVARSKRSPPQVIRMWMKSHGHRVNILNPQFKEIGIGITTTENGDKYFTQVYGTQR